MVCNLSERGLSEVFKCFWTSRQLYGKMFFEEFRNAFTIMGSVSRPFIYWFFSDDSDNVYPKNHECCKKAKKMCFLHRLNRMIFEQIVLELPTICLVDYLRILGTKSTTLAKLLLSTHTLYTNFHEF
jgi:hypothetical protein